MVAGEGLQAAPGGVAAAAGGVPARPRLLFTPNVAVVVDAATGCVHATLPTSAALKTLEESSPHVLAGDTWATQRMAELDASPAATDPAPRWHRQTWFDRTGSIWTARRVADGVQIARDNAPLHVVSDDEEAENIGLHPILVEFVAELMPDAA